ncbi:TylF/MycF/NovP-related O-methyltransferase [Dongia sp.]|uniref:TylF/MycF/NovP-related O-methyltransferase n=1 Tax=Dongia sp. TaxID=1977262 RepID=UPI0035AE1519
MKAILRHLRGVFEAADLSATARSVRQTGLTYLSKGKMKRLERAVDDVLGRGVEGDIAEFGVALGGSAIVLAERAKRHGRRFHGFDVFAMIPPPASDKDDAKSRDRYEKIASGQSEGIGGETYYGYRDNLYDDVCHAFRAHGLDPGGGTIALHKGLFEDTLPRAGLDRIAFAHIDCDWYDPVSYCLNGVAARLSPGGIVLVDDYHDYGGCRTATDEFLDNRSDFALEDGENVILRHAAHRN